MTTEEFNARYKLLKQIAQGAGRSFTAQDVASGRAVLAHFLADGLIPPGGQFRDLMDRLSSRDRSKVLEILSVGPSTVVITQFLEDFETFELWLQRRLDGGRPPTALPEAAAPTGDFTKLFQQGSDAGLGRPPAAPPLVRPPRDSFTELFETPPEPMAQARPLPPPATPPVEILRVRLPASDPVPPVASAPPPLPMPSWPGSFDPPKAPAPMSPLPSPMLGSQTPPPVAPPPIIRTPALESLPPPAPVPGWSGESDYTRQLSPTPAPIDAAPPIPSPAPLDAASGAKPAPAGGSQSIVPLLLVLNIVVIIATGVILYFALKKS